MTPPGPAGGEGTGSLRSRAVLGAVWSGAERASVQLLNLVTFVVLGRLLEPAVFGVVALGAACIAVVQLLADQGISSWLTQADRVTDDDASTAFWTVLAFCWAGALLLFLGAGGVAGLLGSAELEPVLRLLSASLLLVGLGSGPAALLARDLRFKELAARRVASVVAGSVAGVGLALAGYGVHALVGQLLVQQAVAVVVLYAAARWRPRAVWSPRTAAAIASYGVKTTGIVGLQQLRDRGEPFLIGGILGVTALGYWVIAARLLSVVLDLSLTVVSTVAGPVFAKLRDDPERLTRAYSTSLAVCSLVVGPALVGLAVLSPGLVPLLFGSEWEPSGPVAALLAVGGLATAMTYFDRPLLVARQRLGVELAVVAVVVVLHLGLIAVVGPAGLVPLAAALAARPFVTWPLRLVVLHRTVGLPWRAQGRPALVLLACALAGGAALAVGRATGLGDGWGGLAAQAVVLAGLLALAGGLAGRTTVVTVVRDLAALRRSVPAER